MNIDKLVNVHPRVVDVVTRIKFAMTELGYPMMVTDGARTVDQQQALFRKGRDQAGHVIEPHAIVTNCDGIVNRSNHQLDPKDGLGRAVDMCFLVDNKPSWAETMPWALYGLMAETLGLAWGGRWHHPIDRPHIELMPGKS